MPSVERGLESPRNETGAVTPARIPGGSPVDIALAVPDTGIALADLDSGKRAELMRALQRHAGNAATARMLQRDHAQDLKDNKAKFHGLVAAENWTDAVDALKWFNATDIKRLLRPLSTNAVIALRDAAAKAYPGDIATNPDH